MITWIIAPRCLRWRVKWPCCVCSFCTTVTISKIISIFKIGFKIWRKLSSSINKLLFPVALWHLRSIETPPNNLYLIVPSNKAVTIFFQSAITFYLWQATQGNKSYDLTVSFCIILLKFGEPSYTDRGGGVGPEQPGGGGVGLLWAPCWWCCVCRELSVSVEACL